ncbi:hypothetical protein AA0117_g950 [Alternaria alternata]|uniref:PEBP-like protein n=1 Tax=Alternaria alternata TaxID=5599 RepID=A0A4Q4NYD6_ALTAL|nr:hypothetical protein AA0117_g950 [Alternaria alternata]
MFTKTILSATALLAGVATAATAPGVPIQVSQNLTVMYGNNTVSPGGELIPRPETAQPPTISSPVWFADEQGPGRCVLLMVDLDVPRNNSRVQLVHWIATNVTRSVPISANTTGSPLVIPSDNPVPYLQPSPPVGDIPHSYTFILMAQPRNFSIPSMYDDLADNRVGFNVSQFAADANLTNGIAATWITVQNLTETPTNTSFPPPRPSPTGDGADSGGAASGDASGMMIAGRTFWAAMSTTVVAVVFAIAL